MKTKKGLVVLLLFLILVRTAVSQESAQKDVVIMPKQMIENIKVGDFIERYITVINNRDSQIKFSVDAIGRIGEILDIESKEFSVDAGQTKAIKIVLLGRELGFYNGSLYLSGDITEKVLINVTVSEIIGVPIEALKMEIEPYYTRVGLGDNYKFQVILHNLLAEKKFNVTLIYSIDAIYKESTYKMEKPFLQESETVELSTSLSFLKEFRIPKFLKPGTYVMNIQAGAKKEI